MSDWLSVIIVILIIGIVLDGIRRARNNRRNNIKLSKNARKADSYFANEAKLEARSREFPSGGARARRNDDDDELSQADAAEQSRQPVQGSFELQDPVPILMESVEDEDEAEESEQDSVKAEAESGKSGDEPLMDDSPEPSLGALTDLDTPASTQSSDPDTQAAEHEPSGSGSRGLSSSIFSKKSDSQPEHEEHKDATETEILVINVMARSGEQFAGDALLDALMQQKLKFGQMDIFHRHLHNDGDAEIVFSLANIIEPGRFDLANMKNVATPGVCLFLSLPTACGAIEAYEDLVSTARQLAQDLHGELKDENRSALTNQTIEHGRQRVMEFERKIKLKKRS